jgi:putative Holliday junction resolvase
MTISRSSFSSARETELADIEIAQGPVVAFDLGDRRIGIAVSDADATIAFGRETVTRSGEALPWRALLAVLEREGAGGVVVGDPLHLDGSSGERSQAARRFADEMGERSGLPVALQDERLTSVQAQRTLVAVRPGRAKKKRGPEDVDQVAAVLILQTWLDRRSAHRSDGGGP